MKKLRNLVTVFAIAAIVTLPFTNVITGSDSDNSNEFSIEWILDDEIVEDF